MDDSESSLQTSRTPKVYKKLVDYSTHRAASLDALGEKPGRDKAKALLGSSHHVSLNSGMSLKGPHKHHKHGPLSCTSHKMCRERTKFLTKTASVVSVLDSSATFGGSKASALGLSSKKLRKKSSNANLVHTSLSAYFGRATRCLAEEEEDETSRTRSLSLSEVTNEALAQESVHTLDSSKQNSEAGLSEKEKQAVQERRAKMNWLANNTCKKDLTESPSHPPKFLKVIYPPAEDSSITSTTTNTSTSSLPVIEEANHKPQNTAVSQPAETTLDRRQLMMDAKSLMSFRNLDLHAQSSKAAAPFRVTTRRRSSTSFVAGSRIRVFNVYR